MKHSLLLFVVLLLNALQTIQAQNYSFEEIPKWVKTIEIPDGSSISKYEIMSGYYLKLADYQVFLEEDAVFNHEVRSVISYSGITNASQLSITYDTTYQQLKIHHLYILRNGKKIDRTKDLSLEIMNNEFNLNQGIYTGKITAYDNLNDIRKDDLIDFAYTLIGNNPIFENEKYLFIPLEAINPIDLFAVRILYPNEKDYTYKCVDCDSLNISISDVDGYRQIEIYNKSVPAFDYEDNVPTWFIQFKYFTLSSFKSWKDVNNWAYSVFALNEEPKLDVVFDEIFTGEETTAEKINKIINYVQDEIRYMGIESGIGSIKPFPPEQVVKQRFGDCKDKSLLLVSLLKKIGVEKVYPVLVNTNLKYQVDKQYPNNEIFDHCIVTFDYNNITYWVDPSIALQGGDFKNLYTTDYGKVLIIGMASDSLQLMSPRKTEAVTDIVEVLTVKSFTEPAELKITSTRYGFEADNRRLLFEYYSIKDYSKSYTDNLRLLFPVIKETEDLKISDDIDKNIFSVNYNYEVDDFWKDGDEGAYESAKGYWIFKYEPLILYEFWNITTCEDREFDFEINYPLDLNYKIIFHFPKNLFFYDDFQSIDNKIFYFEKKIEQLSVNSFQINYNFRIKSDCIKAADYKKICEEKNSIAKSLPIIIYFPK